MSERQFNTALEDCITRLANGESIADCVRRYPEFAADLAVLLEAGLVVKRVEASDAEVALSQARVAERFEAALNAPIARPTRSRRLWHSLSLLAAALAILVFANIALAQGSLPGDWNYSIKRISESTLLLFTGDEEQFAQRRLEEIASLLVLQRRADLDFQGEIMVVRDSSFSIVGLEAEIEASPEIVAELRPDQQVRILANTTANGQLIARQVDVIDNRDAEPEIIISPSPVITETATASATLTATASDTAISPTIAATDSPTAGSNEAACVVSVPNGWIAYVIQSGDTLSGLATRSGASLETIIRVNCIADPSLISVGQTIYFPVAAQNEAPEEATIVPTNTDAARPNEQAPAATRPATRPNPTATRGR